VFSVTTNGALSTLVLFNGTNGAEPRGALVQGSDGNLYGTTAQGGLGYGTVYRLVLVPVVTTPPQSQTNRAGARAVFSVSATSSSPIEYQWQRNGTNLVDGGNLSGVTTDTLNINNISDTDAGSYAVVVSNAYGSVTNYARLAVNDFLLFASQPQSQMVAAGSIVTFSATVYGAPPFVFQWYFNGAPVGSPTTGTNFSSYTLTNVGTNQSGSYSVRVVNGYGSLTSSNAVLTVVLPPVITAQPASRTNNAASTATFYVGAASAAPLSYQWQKNGTNLLNGAKILGAMSSTLTITAVSSNDVAVYAVVVTNLAGASTSFSATLTVVDPPTITVQPLNQRVLLGSGVSFTVSVSGVAPFRYQWRFNGISLPYATNAAYAIQSVVATNTGNYSVVVTNLAGSVTSGNALLTVIVPPTLGLQLCAGYPFLTLNGMLSNNFIVQYNDDLTDSNWLNLLSISNLSVTPYLFLDPAGANQPGRFYRAFMQ
jgi:hypothetical protein